MKKIKKFYNSYFGRIIRYLTFLPISGILYILIIGFLVIINRFIGNFWFLNDNLFYNLGINFGTNAFSAAIFVSSAVFLVPNFKKFVSIILSSLIIISSIILILNIVFEWFWIYHKSSTVLEYFFKCLGALFGSSCSSYVFLKNGENIFEQVLETFIRKS